MTLPIIDCPSPNYSDRKGREISLVIIHYTGMLTCEASLERLCDETSEVSAHYLIDEDGTLFKLVPEDCRAWHAGVSEWQGETDINSVSIGIELQNPGHEHGYQGFPAAQITSLIALLKDIQNRHAITSDQIIGHEDVAPGRKCDPGDKFPWDQVRGAFS